MTFLPKGQVGYCVVAADAGGAIAEGESAESLRTGVLFGLEETVLVTGQFGSVRPTMHASPQ